MGWTFWIYVGLLPLAGVAGMFRGRTEAHTGRRLELIIGTALFWPLVVTVVAGGVIFRALGWGIIALANEIAPPPPAGPAPVPTSTSTSSTSSSAARVKVR